MRTFTKPKIHFLKSLPEKEQILASKKRVLVIYDEVLLENEFFKGWLNDFEFSYGVKAGEPLKSIESFPEHFHSLQQKISSVSRKSLHIIAVGGGSVGDFAGFFASVYKRGVGLVHMPSTWLACIDSAHGGKTALNGRQAKNQLGSFYFAQEVFVCQALLGSIPEKEIQSGVGELFKMALLSGGSLWEKLCQHSGGLNFEALWEMLPAAIDKKYQVVEKDPFEDTSVRQILNLGHSFGHALEKKFSLSHGEAVLQGLHFCLGWSLQEKYLPVDEYEKIISQLGQLSKNRANDFESEWGAEQVKHLLLADKKINANDELDFVFLKKLGEAYVKSVSLSSVLQELQRQGWVG